MGFRRRPQDGREQQVGNNEYKKQYYEKNYNENSCNSALRGNVANGLCGQQDGG